MATHSPAHDVLDRLLDRHGTTYAEEAGITLHDKPSPLFELVVLTHLLSANLSADLGIRAADAMRREYRTAAAMADASDEDRWRVLSDARYLRKERTAELLGRMARQVVDDWSGDLRRLRDDADGDADGVAERVRDLPGIGAVGGDIFTREVQAVWPSLRPRADRKVLDTAGALGLPTTAAGLADLHGSTDLSRVGAALVRCELAGDHDVVRG
jgi:endonuclease III